MKTEELVALSPDLSIRKIDNWCHRGIFGDDKSAPGRGKTRDFNDQEVRIALVLGAVSAALERWSNGRGGAVDLYRAIAQEMRHGGTVVEIELATGITFTVDSRLVP